MLETTQYEPIEVGSATRVAPKHWFIRGHAQDATDRVTGVRLISWHLSIGRAEFRYHYYSDDRSGWSIAQSDIRYQWRFGYA